jgi:endo-1,4-beta-xylanase
VTIRRRAGAVLATATAVVLLGACLPHPPGDLRCEPRCGLADAGRRAQVQVGLFGQDFGLASQMVIAREASMIVNHGFSWNVIEPVRGEWNFAPADAVDAFARRERLREFAFHFAWDNELLDDLPAWVAQITDPAELRAVLRTRARRIFERYPHLRAIDVINEPIDTFGSALTDNHFHRVLGPDYIVELFDIVAAEAPPWTRLFVNENFVEYRADKSDALVALVTDLVARGVPVDAVGLQTHLLLGEPDWALLRSTMDRLAALGVRVMITEVDVPVAASVPDRFDVQATRYQRVVETCLAVRACDTLNVWGVDDGHTWLDSLLGPGTDPLLFDRQLRAKPAYFAVRDALLDGRRGRGGAAR